MLIEDRGAAPSELAGEKLKVRSLTCATHAENKIWMIQILYEADMHQDHCKLQSIFRFGTLNTPFPTFLLCSCCFA